MASSNPKTNGLVTRAVRAATTRPLFLGQYARMWWLFRWTGLLRALTGFGTSPRFGVKLGRNVRLQKLGALRAEIPGAAIAVGDHSIVYEHARVEAYGTGRIEIGECAVLGDVRIYAREKIRLGDRVITSWNVFIQDFDPHPIDPSARAAQVHDLCANFVPGDGSLRARGGGASAFPASAIEIGDDVWLGAGAMILKGARIGAGSIVAAGAVVTKGEYPARSVLAGNPAKVVKTL